MYDFLQVITLKVVFSAQKPGNLPPYLGSTIRGILGHCFREFVCHTPEVKCFCCEQRADCLYVRNFSNTGGEGGAINPFVIHSVTEGKTQWEVGDDCIFELNIFGRSALSPGIYLDALIAMQQKGWGVERIPFTLKSITETDSGKLIYAAGRTWGRNLIQHPMKIECRTSKAALIAFDTPVRIVSGKGLFDDLPFQQLIRFLVRRFSLVTQVYTDYTLDWNLEELLEKASEVRTLAQEWNTINFTRYSMNHKDNKLELPSKKGWALYEGAMSSFVPILEVGKYLQVGKNTTIGFGHFEVFYD